MPAVSHAVPAIHPKFAIDTQFSNHHPGFTSRSNLPEAHVQALRAGKAMALTVLDLVGRPGMMEEVQSAFGG